MKSDLKKKIYAIAAAASNLERLTEPVASSEGKPLGEKAKAMNALLDAVQQLPDEARQILEDVVG